MARSHSSVEDAPLLEKWRQALTFFRWRLGWGSDPGQLDYILESLDWLASTYERVSGKRFADARVFEIGYGARPVRLIALNSMGIDVRGIDLDAPMMRFSVARLFDIVKTNGPVRAMKTAVRNVLFDRKDEKTLEAALGARGHKLTIDEARLLVGDAARFDFGEDKYDLIYSFDVFEHIPPVDLEAVVAHLGSALTPGGMAVIVPLVFTGICGGHLPEWYAHLVDEDARKDTEPWEHLRKSRKVADVYLNRLARGDYRKLFSNYFEIVEETDQIPELGKRWLTPEVREELAAWSDEDLFSNSVVFVLRARRDD